MSNFRILNYASGAVLYAGNFPSPAACLEQAVRDNADLSYADLRYKDLRNAALDGALLEHADFTGANLGGANLSECRLAQANFAGAVLYDACLCESDLHGASFENASFGATDITGARLTGNRFSTLSCFSLDFSRAERLLACSFKNPDGQVCQISRPPLVIHGLYHQPVIFMDYHLKIGHRVWPYREFPRAADLPALMRAMVPLLA